MLPGILPDAGQQILKQVEAAVDVAYGVDRLTGRDRARPRRRRKAKQTSQHLERLPPQGGGRNSLHPRYDTLELGDAAFVLGGCPARPARLLALGTLASAGTLLTATAGARTRGARAPLVRIGAVVRIVPRVVVAVVAVLVERVLGEIHLVDDDADAIGHAQQGGDRALHHVTRRLRPM